MGFSRNCCVFALFTFRVKITRNISSSFFTEHSGSGVVFVLVRRLRSLRGAALNICVVLELRRNIPSPAVNNGVHRTWHRLTAFFINYHKTKWTLILHLLICWWWLRQFFLLETLGQVWVIHRDREIFLKFHPGALLVRWIAKRMQPKYTFLCTSSTLFRLNSCQKQFHIHRVYR